MSPTKKQLADAAYERAEDQRALVVVIAAALGEERSEERARIYESVERVKRAFLRIDAPAKSPELPGQLAIDGSVVGESVTAEPRELGAPMAEAFDVPKQCPACGENMLLVWGGSWTPLRPVATEWSLQCGFCGHIENVTQMAHDAVVAERHRTVGASDVTPVKAKREQRTRGAG